MSFFIQGSDLKKDDFIKVYEMARYAQAIELAELELAENPQNFNAWYYKGLSEKALYKYIDAINSFEHAIKFTSNQNNLLYLLALCYEKVGNSPKAIITYNKLIKADTLHVPALNSLAIVYKSQREYAEAIELYSKLVKIDTTNAYYYAQLAYCCNKYGLNEPVIYFYEKALLYNPNDLESCNYLAIELINQKYYTDAKVLLDSFLITFPDNIRLLKRKALLLALEAKYLDAVNGFKHIVELGDTSMFTCKYYGQSLYNNGQYDDAIYWLKRYVNGNTKDAKNQFILALAYQKDYQYENSLKHLHMAMGKLYNKSLIAKMFTETGNTYAKYGDYCGFRDSLSNKKSEMYDLAKQNYLKALEININDPELYKLMGNFYEHRIHDAKIALYYYEKYYKHIDPAKIDENTLVWAKDKIRQLKEEVHFIGD